MPRSVIQQRWEMEKKKKKITVKALRKYEKMESKTEDLIIETRISLQKQTSIQMFNNDSSEYVGSNAGS